MNLELFDNKNYIEGYFERKIRPDKELLPENVKALESWYQDLHNMTEARKVKCLITVRNMTKVLGKSVSETTNEDMKKLVRYIEVKDYTLWTKHDYLAILKKFYTWANKQYKLDLDLTWIKIPKSKLRKLPEGMLSQEDVQTLIDACDSIRDKAIVLTLYESGCRISEILTLNIKNLQFDKYGCVLLVNGKTGWRRVRVIKAASILEDYMKSHPFKSDPESYLWLTRFGKTSTRKDGYSPLTYRGVSKLLVGLQKKTGINKHLNPHNFRHSRATHLANSLTEAQMKEHFGWTQSSEMASVYVHLSGRDVDDAILKASGMTRQDALDTESNKKAFDNLLYDFFMILAEDNPKIKDKFKDIVKQKGLEGLFQ